MILSVHRKKQMRMSIISQNEKPQESPAQGAFLFPDYRVGLILFVALFLLGQLLIDMVGYHTGYNRNTERKQIIEHHTTSFCAINYQKAGNG